MTQSSIPTRAAQLDQRLLSYFGNGGLFNPEFMEHDKVRDLLLDLQQFIRDLNRDLNQSSP